MSASRPALLWCLFCLPAGSVVAAGTGAERIAGEEDAVSRDALGGNAATAFDYRGYLQYAAAHDTIDRGSVLNPGNALDLSSHRSRATLDLHASATRGGLRAVAEGYGQADLVRGDSDLDLYQGYLAWSSPDHRHFLRVGRAVLGWGTGQIWNPVRAITSEAREDLVFPDEAVQGIDVLEARTTLAGATLTLLALAPDGGGDARWGYALRYADSAGQLDYALSVYSDLHGSQRVGGEFSLPLGRLTLVGEAVLADEGRGAASRWAGTGPRDGATVSYVLGANVALPRDMLLIVEHYRDGAGMDTGQARRFREGLPADADRYQPFGNGRDHLYAGLSRQLGWRDGAATLGVFANGQSRSALLQGRLEAQLGEAARLQLSYLEYLEDADGTDVGYLDRSIEARVRVNF